MVNNGNLGAIARSAPKFALFTKGSKLPLNQGFQNRSFVTTVSRQALDNVDAI